jgi:hypothetical protein
MLIFIDESGIHKTKDHSCVALVYIEIKNIENIEKGILDLEKKLKRPFHWAHTLSGVKRDFFKGIAKLDFFAKVAIIQNPIHLHKDTENILQHLIIEKNIKQIFIDGKQPKWYERKLKKVLRDKGISVKKLKTVDDKSFAGIRLADAVAGAARSYYDNPKGKSSIFYDMIKSKVVFVLQKTKTTPSRGGQTTG